MINRKLNRRQAAKMVLGFAGVGDPATGNEVTSTNGLCQQQRHTRNNPL